MTITPADLTNLERLLAEYEKPVYHTDDRLQVTINLEAALVAAAPDLIKCARELELWREYDAFREAMYSGTTNETNYEMTIAKCEALHRKARAMRKAALSAGQTGVKDGQ